MEQNKKTDRTWATIDKNLRRLCEIDARLDKIESEKKSVIERATAKALARGSNALKTRNRLETENSDTMEKVKAKLNGIRSKKLNYGTIGFRKATRIDFLEGWDEKRVIAKLQELYGGNKFLQSLSDKLDQDKKFIRNKIQIDLIAIKNSDFTNDELAQFGCQRVVYDRVWYKTIYQELKNHEEIKTTEPEATEPAKSDS